MLLGSHETVSRRLTIQVLVWVWLAVLTNGEIATAENCSGTNVGCSSPGTLSAIEGGNEASDPGACFLSFRCRVPELRSIAYSKVDSQCDPTIEVCNMMADVEVYFEGNHYSDCGVVSFMPVQGTS